jgi:DNA primase
MARDFAKEVKKSVQKEAAFKSWMQARIEQIKNQVTAGDVLSKYGVDLRKHGNQAEQISCPFHGTDKKPSAKYFPDEDQSPSHVWCYVCRERWDVFKLWMKFTGVEFGAALFQIERAFGIPPPETNAIPDWEPEYNPLTDTVEDLFHVCEKNLREYRDRFDMEPHLKLGLILDQTRYRLARGALTLEQARDRLQMVSEKILKMVIERAKATADSQP